MERNVSDGGSDSMNEEQHYVAAAWALGDRRRSDFIVSVMADRPIEVVDALRPALARLLTDMGLDIKKNGI